MLTTSFDSCQGNGGSVSGDFAELSASTEDIPSSTLANERIEAGIAEGGLKTEHVLFWGTTETASRKFVKGDQVDLAP